MATFYVATKNTRAKFKIVVVANTKMLIQLKPVSKCKTVTICKLSNQWPIDSNVFEPLLFYEEIWPDDVRWTKGQPATFTLSPPPAV